MRPWHTVLRLARPLVWLVALLGTPILDAPFLLATSITSRVERARASAAARKAGTSLVVPELPAAVAVEGEMAADLDQWFTRWMAPPKGSHRLAPPGGQSHRGYSPGSRSLLMPATLKVLGVMDTRSRPSTARTVARIWATPPLRAAHTLNPGPSAPEVPPMAVR